MNACCVQVGATCQTSQTWSFTMNRKRLAWLLRVMRICIPHFLVAYNFESAGGAFSKCDDKHLIGLIYTRMQPAVLSLLGVISFCVLLQAGGSDSSRNTCGQSPERDTYRRSKGKKSGLWGKPGGQNAHWGVNSQCCSPEWRIPPFCS